LAAAKVARLFRSLVGRGIPRADVWAEPIYGAASSSIATKGSRAHFAGGDLLHDAPQVLSTTSIPAQHEHATDRPILEISKDSPKSHIGGCTAEESCDDHVSNAQFNICGIGSHIFRNHAWMPQLCLQSRQEPSLQLSVARMSCVKARAAFRGRGTTDANALRLVFPIGGHSITTSTAEASLTGNAVAIATRCRLSSRDAPALLTICSALLATIKCPCSPPDSIARLFPNPYYEALLESEVHRGNALVGRPIQNERRSTSTISLRKLSVYCGVQFRFRGSRELHMIRTFAFSVLLILGLAMPVTDVMAQSSAGRGAVGGAIIGGAVGGRRGAAIGAATGAAMGARRDRRGRYYWRHGRCWVRAGGRSHPVSSRYCR
jgi:hypothetical protein